jgi:hypothetical protein
MSSGCVRVRLMDAERITLRVEVVALPGHPGDSHLGKRDLTTGIEDASFGCVVIGHLDGADVGVGALGRPMAPAPVWAASHR